MSGTPSEQDGRYFCTVQYRDGTAVSVESGEIEALTAGGIDNICLFQVHDQITGNIFQVNLDNGLFMVNNVVLDFDLGIIGKDEAGNTVKIQQDAFKFKLIYFRRNREFAKIVDGEDGAKLMYSDHVILPAIGWQTNYANENYQRIMLLKPDGTVTVLNKK